MPVAWPGSSRRWAAVVIIGMVLFPATARGESPQEIADWTAVGANVATGTLLGQPISLSGTHVFDLPISRVDGSWPDFAGPDFTPPLTTTDVIQIGATTPAESYTLQFGSPVIDPVLYVGSLGSRLDFPAGTQITKISGDSGFTVSGSTVTGTPRSALGPDGVNDANGTVQLAGTFASISFSATYVLVSPEDGVLLQAGASAPPMTPPPPPPPPTTTTTPPPPTTPPPATTPTPSAVPVPGRTAAATVSSGVVLIKTGSTYRPLTGATSVPIGSTIDARKGTVTITTAADPLPAGDPRHRLQTGTFSAGIFAIKQQPQRHRKQTPSTDVLLETAPHAIAHARCTRTGPPTKGIVRMLHGVVKGVYRVLAGASTIALTHGTFTVQDRCDGTLTHLTRGRATVTITRGRHRILHLSAGRSYLAQARLFAAKQKAARGELTRSRATGPAPSSARPTVDARGARLRRVASAPKGRARPRLGRRW